VPKSATLIADYLDGLSHLSPVRRDAEIRMPNTLQIVVQVEKLAGMHVLDKCPCLSVCRILTWSTLESTPNFVAEHGAELISFISMYYKDFLRSHWSQEEMERLAHEMKSDSVNKITFKVCRLLKNKSFLRYHHVMASFHSNITDIFSITNLRTVPKAPCLRTVLPSTLKMATAE